jgi:hypothetical protein
LKKSGKVQFTPPHVKGPEGETEGLSPRFRVRPLNALASPWSVYGHQTRLFSAEATTVLDKGHKLEWHPAHRHGVLLAQTRSSHWQQLDLSQVLLNVMKDRRMRFKDSDFPARYVSLRRCCAFKAPDRDSHSHDPVDQIADAHFLGGSMTGLRL